MTDSDSAIQDNSAGIFQFVFICLFGIEYFYFLGLGTEPEGCQK